jgi:hypothetical protein
MVSRVRLRGRLVKFRGLRQGVKYGDMIGQKETIRGTYQNSELSSKWYDKVPETKKLFSLFCGTVFAVWKHLEAFEY